ncbi:uncharacterized protein LOC120338218 [Styela clava]
MNKESLTLIVLLFLKFTNADIDCSYKGDMCKVEVEDCLKKKLYDGDMTDCTGISHQDLFISRDDVKFWIDIYEKGDYAQNLTYTIISEIGENWRSVGDCCRMTPTSTCMLPKRKKDEVFFIYLPMRKSGHYCELQLFEYQEELKWCSETDRTPCKELVRGIISIKGIYQPLSTDSFYPPVDFCFFHAPSDFVQTGNESHSEFSRDVKGIEQDENQNSVLVGKTLKRCDLLENITAKNITEHILSRYKRNSEETMCFFTRLKGYDNKWSSNPICQRPCNNDKYCYLGQSNVTWKTLVITLSISTILLIIVFFTWKYRKSVARCRPSLEASIKELPDSFVARNTEDCAFVDDVNFESIHYECVKEIPNKLKSKKSIYEKESNEFDRYISVLTGCEVMNTTEEEVDLISKPRETSADVHQLQDKIKNRDIAHMLHSDDVSWDQQDSGFETGIVDSHCSSFECPRASEKNTNTDSGFSESSKRSSSDCDNISQTGLSCVIEAEIDENEASFVTNYYTLPEIEDYTNGNYMEKSAFLTIPDAEIRPVGNDVISRRQRKSSSSSGCVSFGDDNCSLESSIEDNTDIVADDEKLDLVRETLNIDTIDNVKISLRSTEIPGCYVEK